MKRSLHFCKSWFRAKKRPTEVWSLEQAKAAHANKQPYTVLVDSVEKPFCFIEITGKAVGVGFLDTNLRESLSYAFKEIEPGKLFLSMATHREFESEGDKVARGITYIFGQDGTVKMKRESFNPHRVETSESTADVSANYSPAPAFGQYDDLIRIERS